MGWTDGFDRDEQAVVRDAAARARDERADASAAAADARDLEHDESDRLADQRDQEARDDLWAQGSWEAVAELAGVDRGIVATTGSAPAGETVIDRERGLGASTRDDVRELLEESHRDREQSALDRGAARSERDDARASRDAAGTDRMAAASDRERSSVERDQAEIDRNSST